MNVYVVCDFIYKDGDVYNLLRNYFSKDILKDLYFNPKKIDRSNISKKLDGINYIDYSNKINNIIDLYKDINLVDYIKTKINYFIDDTGFNIDNKDIYVIIGLDTSTIYTTKYNYKDVTVICLESANSIKYLDMLLAHEFTHYVRSKYIDHDIFEDFIGERFITEGIACLYSKFISNMEDYECCIVFVDTYNWVLNNIDLLDKLVENNLDSNKDIYKYFYMYAEIDIPVRTGYVYGYIKVKEYLKNNNLNIKDIMTIDWKSILKK